MENAFSLVLNMTLTGSLVIALVLLGRFLLRKQPKIFSYALWAVVLFRLLCPVSISAPVSALNVAKPEVAQTGQTISRVSFVPAEPVTISVSAPQTAAAPVVAKKSVEPMTIAAWVWLAGLGVMVVYSAGSYAALRKKLVGSVPLEGNVYLSDYVDSPFVMGVLLPKIYLPTSTPRPERRFILAHEQHHIRRFDHIWKLLAYLALCLHWFNPLVWLSFLLAGKDMEMSCDEAVIGKLGSHARADYATALLRLSTKRTVIRGTPLAFGEGDTKGRVKNMANWKKPKVWVSLICAVACVIVLVACAVNPSEETPTEPKAKPEGTEYVSVQVPEGFAYDENSMYITRKADGKLVGGVKIYTIPEGIYDPEDPHFQWLYQLGIQDLEAEKAGELYFKGGMSGFSCDWLMEFTSNEEKEADRTVHRRHYFYVVDDLVYDVWEDDLEVEVNTFDSILRFSEEDTDGTLETTAPNNTYRTLYESPLPEGYVFVNEELMTEAESMKTSDQPHDIVGGLTSYDIPDDLERDMYFNWLDEIGIPDVDDPTLAHMGTGGSYCDWVLEVFSEVPDGQPVTVHRYHEFTVIVNEEGHATLYDVWFDATQIDYSLFAGFLTFPEAQAPEADTGEQEAFQRSMEVIANVGTLSHQLHGEAQGPGGSTTIVEEYKIHNGDGLHIEQVDGSYQEAVLVVGEEYFYGTGDIGGEIAWKSITPKEYGSLQMQRLWLGHSTLTEAGGAAYMGTLLEEDGSQYVYRFEDIYASSRWSVAEEQSWYQVNLQFDRDGNFLWVQIGANLTTENEILVRESIVTLEEATVRAAIDREYERAKGN